MEKVFLTEICSPKQWKTISGEEILKKGKYPVYGANGKIGYYDDFNHDEREEISRMILDGDIKSFSDEMLDTIRALAKVALGEVILRGKRNRPQTDDIY